MKQGRLRFSPDSNDKRGKTLHLTEQGIIRDFGVSQAETLTQEWQRLTQIVVRHAQDP